MRRTISVLAIGFSILGIGSSSSAQSGSVTVQWRDDSKQESDGGGYKKKGGPPPHAPAHSYRAKHQYCYYPYHNVYHEPARGLYFYMSGGGWRVGASLPASLTGVNLEAFVNIDLDSDRPYDHNRGHVKEYPREKYKPGKDDKGNGYGQGKGTGGKQ